MTATADVVVRDEGTIYLFEPRTDRARRWIADYVEPDARWFGHHLVVEHRYARELALGMAGDLLEVEFR